MAVICPAVLAEDKTEYNRQIKNTSGFAKRIQIDLMDGKFTRSKSIELKDVWWPKGFRADLHLMYQTPDEYLADVIKMKPHMVIIHAEATADPMLFAAYLHRHDILAGLAILPETSVASIERELHSFDHIMIFSGDLGHFGGEANLNLLSKVSEVHNLYPEVEIGWDGGVNTKNAKALANGGVDILNSGGFIQNSKNPKQAFELLVSALA